MLRWCALLLAMLPLTTARAEVADRRLGVEAGAHEIVAVAGPKLQGPAQAGALALTGFVGYRYGLTDSLEYQLPLRVGYHVRPSRGFEVAISGGLIGFGVEGSDPTRYVLPLRLGTSVKLASAPMAFVGAVHGTLVEELGTGQNERSITASVSLLLDLSPSLSLVASLGAQLSYEGSGERSVHLALLGLASDGYSPLPTLWWHLNDHASLVLAPSWSRDLSRGGDSYAARAGIFVRL